MIRLTFEEVARAIASYLVKQKRLEAGTEVYIEWKMRGSDGHIYGKEELIVLGPDHGRAHLVVDVTARPPANVDHVPFKLRLVKDEG